MPGSHHARFIDVLHREHAVVEDNIRVNKAMGLRNLPSKDLDRQPRLGPGRQHRPLRLHGPDRGGVAFGRVLVVAY